MGPSFLFSAQRCLVPEAVRAGVWGVYSYNGLSRRNKSAIQLNMDFTQPPETTSIRLHTRIRQHNGTTGHVTAIRGNRVRIYDKVPNNALLSTL